MPSTAPITITSRFALAGLCLMASGLANAGSIDVFTCKEGQLTTRRVILPYSDANSLVAAGNAIWASKQVDKATITAVAEGKGVWAYAPLNTIFRILNTKTDHTYLAAIATQESGRGGRFWPWTINFKGQGYFYPGKHQAIAAAKHLLANGFESIDIGMMQVNWRYHRHRFESLEMAFDPDINVRVADSIIQEHLRETGSIYEALGRYHSKTPSLKTKYLRSLGKQIRTVSISHNLKRNQPC